MDGQKFDSWTKTWARATSRRGVLRAVGLAAVGAKLGSRATGSAFAQGDHPVSARSVSTGTWIAAVERPVLTRCASPREVAATALVVPVRVTVAAVAARGVAMGSASARAGVSWVSSARTAMPTAAAARAALRAFVAPWRAPATALRVRRSAPVPGTAQAGVCVSLGRVSVRSRLPMNWTAPPGIAPAVLPGTYVLQDRCAAKAAGVPVLSARPASPTV